MRSLLANAALAIAVTTGLLAAVPSAQADKRIFIIANDGDSYGVDRCLASGAVCGAAAAAAYCRSRDFARAASYRKIDRDDITGSVPAAGSGNACRGSACNEFIAIECTR